MDKYHNLKYVIGQFSSEWELTEEEYKENFLTLLEINKGYADKVKAELLQAISDPEWSWVKVGYETNFIGSDDKEESVWLTVKTLVWDVLFPNEKPPKIVQRDD